MRSPLALHLALFRRQKALIAQAVAGPGRAFRAYEARHRRRTARYVRALPVAEVHRRVAEADVVYVGDYHTLPLAQHTYLELVRAARGSGRRVVLALECVEGRHQAALDAFLAGALPERALLARLGAHAQADAWAGFRAVLRHARDERLAAVAIDRRAQGERSLALRDAYAAERVARAARAPDRPLVLVLVGQYHVTPCHLPQQVERALGPAAPRRALVVYQNCEGVFWQLAREGRAGATDAVELADASVCLLNASPAVCQQSFLDALDAHDEDGPLLREKGATERFRELALLIGRLTGVSVAAALEDVEVATQADVALFARLQRRGRFSPAELAQLKRHVLARESLYIPRARLAYLASPGLNHAAEEAAHFVRHCAVGEALDAPRGAQDAFYTRCLEEALGFFGSKLANPRRPAAGVAEWAGRFAGARGLERQVAAFVLAHKAAEAEAPDATAQLLPLGKDRLFHAVSHALGYLLGDALYRAFDAGRVDPAELRALFRDPLPRPREAYLAWARRLS